MARPKRGSRTLGVALKRVASMDSISDTLDLGNGLTLQNYRREVGALESALERYNSTSASLDGLRDGVRSQEKVVREWNDRMLTGVASKYGKDSVEYGQAGGKRTSQRKRRVPKPKAAGRKTESKAEPKAADKPSDSSQPKA